MTPCGGSVGEAKLGTERKSGNLLAKSLGCQRSMGGGPAERSCRLERKLEGPMTEVRGLLIPRAVRSAGQFDLAQGQARRHRLICRIAADSWVAMHTFRVVKEPFGWAVRLGSGMTSPFRTRAHAIQEANLLCDELRGHGECAELLVEDLGATVATDEGDRHSAERLRELLRRLRERSSRG